MFIKKLFYKVTNPEKYNEHKKKFSIERKIKWYKSGFEDKIINIQKKIENQKELSFLHSGHLGDIIDSLAVIRELSKTHKCKFYIETNKAINVKYNTHPGGKVHINNKMANMLLPLLSKQDYFEHVDIYKNHEIDIDLNMFKEIFINMNLDNTRWYFQITGVHADLSLPYLFVEPHKKIKKKIVIVRSARRNNHFINYQFLSKYKNLLFVGTEDEYKLLQKQIPNLDFYNCENFLELAEIIKSSKFFLGNITFGYCIAEALKVPRLLECSDEFSAMHPSGKNAYDFCFQGHFEKWFDYLYNL